MQYRITDNESGKTLVISGDAPPTEQDAEELFNQSGIRNQSTQDLTQGLVQPQEGQQNGNLLTKILGIDANKWQQGQQQISQSNANPLLKAGATAQNALANSGQILPMIYSAAMRAAIPVPGVSTGAGAMLGTRLQQINERGGVQALVPTQQEAGKAALTGVEYGGAELALSALGKLKNLKSPSRMATATRNIDAEKNTATFASDEIKNAFQKAGENSTGGIRQKAIEFAQQDAERIGNKTLSTKELIEEITKQWNASHTSRGVEMTKAQAQYALQARDELMSILKAKAPDIAAQTVKIGKLIHGQENLVKFMKWFIPTSIVAGGVRNMIGGQ